VTFFFPNGPWYPRQARAGIEGLESDFPASGTTFKVQPNDLARTSEGLPLSGLS
jgi:hypothetical protein